MLYRPNFCCHCGEKIARSRWTPLTSRRFCEFCEIEQKQHDLLPRVGAVVALLIGAAGLVSYISGGSSAHSPSAAKPIESVREFRGEANKIVSNQTAKATLKVPETNSTTPLSNSEAAILKQRETRPFTSTEAVYFCGATTRKGTPCTRRVKTKGHCWQHADKAAPAAEGQD
ncbi:MAG: hypothetical protein H0U23_16895 [Blastocatellia bacterium]|nr:hypothetical protein [Blastocatellia bacterium]